jgi:DNA-binding NtrC family response regulator
MSDPKFYSPDSIVVGRSRRMRAIFDFVHVIGESESNVLITGESGTGKEVIANVIHQASPRRHKPFIAVSCALFSETLIESELFGHERGAFTGALKDRPGRFELAQGGTIFLDDIDDVPLSMQVKLLRVLQNRVIERLGGTRPVPVSVRVITGSKRDLRQMVAEGRFREDLYYRLNVLAVSLPPLRERREDIPLLADHFLRRYFRRRGEDMPPVSPAVTQALLRYSWPGNVRELENTCERIAQTCTCGAVRVGCIAASVLFGASTSEPIALPPMPPLPDLTEERETMAVAAQEEVVASVERPKAFAVPLPTEPVPVSLDDQLREVEVTLINWALNISHGNKSKAAELLKIKRSTLGDRINRCGLGRTHEAVPEDAAVGTGS